jgi:hypothetical protein
MTLELKQADSPTTVEIRRLLSRIEQPFTRDRVFKGLRSGGSALSKAAVSGWINRAIKKGELVAAATAGEYYLAGCVPVIKTKPANKTKSVSRTKMVRSRKSLQEIADIMIAVVRGEAGFDLVSGAGGLTV